MISPDSNSDGTVEGAETDSSELSVLTKFEADEIGSLALGLISDSGELCVSDDVPSIDPELLSSDEFEIVSLGLSLELSPDSNV